MLPTGQRICAVPSGEVIEIPNLVRTILSSRMVMLYQTYCKEINFEPLGRSTLFTILKVCAASQKKCLSGLDSMASEGSSAFDSIEDAVRTAGSLGVSLSWIDNIVQRMRAAKMYLKTDFKLHVEEGSPCADHCVFYALSTDEAHWNSSCDHEHSVECDRCNDIIATLKTVDNSQGYQGQIEELQYDVEHGKERILEWKAHILRTINQERSKNNVLDGLAAHQALIVMDWAMKWLPRSYRETQCEWFGKKGISWHVCACITRADTIETEFEVRTYVHIFDSCSQDWFAVASILENVASELTRTAPQLKEIYLRSDNAGCYHNASLLVSAPVIISKKGLTLRDYSFSEANSGKDVCDRKIAPLKAHIERYLN
ncbi:hypothetical protein QZH41_009167, partial [Actinostola sp. cb2023]